MGFTWSARSLLQKHSLVVLLLLVSISLLSFLSSEGSFAPLSDDHVLTQRVNVSLGLTYLLGYPNSTRVCGSLGGSWSNSSRSCTLENSFTLGGYDMLSTLLNASAI